MEEYKQKYEQAMLRMNKWVEGSEIIDPKEVAEFVFPELKESEDEKIRNEIIQSIQDNMCVIHKEKCIAWLERQCEQKPADKIEPKFKVGDIIRHKDSLAEYIIESISGGCYHGKGWGLSIDCDEDYELVEQKPAWSEEDEKMWSTISDLLWEGYKLSDKKVSWNKIRCWLFPKIKSLKERVQHQPKQEWSEEDEKTYRVFIQSLARIAANTRTDSTSLNYTFSREIDWLKSLKERYTWKPSEEQMKALNYVINLMASSESPTENDYYYNVLKDMRTHLKKLR